MNSFEKYVIKEERKTEDILKFKDIISKLHVDSEDFDPDVLLETFHSQTSREILIKASNKLNDDIETQQAFKRNLVNFYVFEFSKCERNLSAIQSSFITIEAKEGEGITSRDKASVSSD